LYFIPLIIVFDYVMIQDEHHNQLLRPRLLQFPPCLKSARKLFLGARRPLYNNPLVLSCPPRRLWYADWVYLPLHRRLVNLRETDDCVSVCSCARSKITLQEVRTLLSRKINSVLIC
jgi:hypothetical protein